MNWTRQRGMKLGILAGLVWAGLSCTQLNSQFNSQLNSQLNAERSPASDAAIAQSPPVASPTTTPTASPSPMPTPNAQLVQANTRFGFKLFSQVRQQSPNENVLISPSSVAIALSMVYNGATGETQQAMAKALEVQDLSLAEVNQANKALEQMLEQADPAVKLTIANSLWGRQGFDFNPDFLQRNQEYYNAEVTTLNFASPDAVGRINGWVNQNTQGKIPEIIDRLDPRDVLFLINAIYFKGSWTQQFDPAQTSDRPFTLLNGATKQQPAMARNGSFRYYETEQFQAVSLPYGSQRLSMYVFLPKSTSNLNAFYQSLTPENWQTWMQRFRPQDGRVQLPRFKVEYNTRLNESLQALGMASAFSDRAEFTNLSAEPTFINDVRHKTFMEVNEEGTEAAAVTSVGVRTLSANVTPPFQMVIDRPFFCAIRDNETGTILFMGSIVEPKS